METVVLVRRFSKCAGSTCSKLIKKAPNSTLFNQFQQRGFKRSAKENFSIRPVEEIPGSMNGGAFHKYVKPVIFTGFVSVASVAGCTIWQYEIYRSALLKESRSLASLLRLSSPPFGEKRGELRNKVNQWWNNLNQGEQIFWPVCALNVLIFLGWRVPALGPMMATWFCANPSSRAVALPMLLSTFSHYSVYHLAANMFVLHSFAPAATSILGREQFLAMYLTSGVVASLGSHFHKLYTRSFVPSLGASGAIMGILGLVCSNMPDIELGIMFIPGIKFSADTALKCLIAVDTFGMLAGWKFLDHAAHLSGCLFGVAFNYYGGKPLNTFRGQVTKQWHEYRTKDDARKPRP